MTLYTDNASVPGALNGANLESANGAWEVLSGNWSKSSGKFVSDATANHIASILTDTADVSISAMVSANGHEGIYFRIQDANNWLRLMPRTYSQVVERFDGTRTYYHTQHVTYLELCTNGAVTVLGQWNPLSYQFDANKDLGAIALKVYAYKSVIRVYQGSEQRPNDFLFMGEVQVNNLSSQTRHGIGKAANRVQNELGMKSVQLDAFRVQTLTTPVPELLYPIDFATVATALPTSQVKRNDIGVPHKIQMQYSTASDFTANVLTIDEPDSEYKPAGTSTFTVSQDTPLAQGTWYARARGVNPYGEYSGWTAAVQFAISHPPSTIEQSPNGSAVDADSPIRLSWRFFDGYLLDQQSAYRVQVERNDTGAQILDTNKVGGSVKFHEQSYPSTLDDVTLRWRVKVWDQEDAESNWSDYFLFTPSTISTVQVTSPAEGAVVATSTPEFAWTFSGVSGRIQKSYRIVVRNLDANTIVLDTGVINSSTDRTYKAGFSVLRDDTSYSFTIFVVDNLGLAAPTVVHNFSVNYNTPPPGVVEVDPTMYGDDGYVFITWSTDPDPDFVMWRIYRRTEEDWINVAEISDPSVSEFKDWFAPSNVNYEYSVVQIVTRFGQDVESELSAPVAGFAETGGYWLIDSITPEASLRLYNVTEDQFKTNKERSEFTVIGRGRHVDVGQDIGRSGSMTLKLRDSQGKTAREKRLLLDAMIAKVDGIFLRSPFGDFYQVSIGDPDYTRIVAGPMEFVDASLTYAEVF